MTSIRPFGPLHWVLDKLPQIKKWSVLGAVATEDRCLAAPEVAFNTHRVSDITLLKIVDPASGTNGLRPQITTKLASVESAAKSAFGAVLTVPTFDLLCAEQEIGDFVSDFLQRCTDNVIVDLSAMPKRFFFPILTMLSQTPRIANLIATYSLPERYGSVLAEDPEEWRPLPMFGGDPLSVDPCPASLIISVGYQPLQVSEILGHVRFGPDRVKLLFPFPSIPPGFVENWKFVLRVKDEWKRLRGNDNELPPESIIRVPTHDASIAFDQLIAHTSGGRAPAVVLAPYGPKPISLAMCLLGIARLSEGIATEIGYTQPHIYHPEYSTGIATNSGTPVVSAYCLRLNGRNLFTLPASK